MPDLLETICAELDTRLDELRPFVSEYEQLLASTTTSEQTAHNATPAPPETSLLEAGTAETSLAPTSPPETSLLEAAPAEASPPETSLAPTSPPETGSAETSPVPIRMHRPRRAPRPAWPKAPRRAGWQAA